MNALAKMMINAASSARLAMMQRMVGLPTTQAPTNASITSHLRVFSSEPKSALASQRHMSTQMHASVPSPYGNKTDSSFHDTFAGMAAAVLAMAVIGLPVASSIGSEEGSTNKIAQDSGLAKLIAEAYSNPYTCSSHAARGLRSAMEDHCRVEMGGRFVAVFDGHRGNLVSSFLKKKLWDEFHLEMVRTASEDSVSVSDMADALHNALGEIERRVLNDPNMAYQGSTAVAALVHTGDRGERTLISANVGDSRAVMSRSRRAVDVTEDHKPNSPLERARIVQQGGEVEWDALGQIYRVKQLALSRSIGDSDAKPIVSGEAEIRQFPIVPGQDEFVVMASDGLWDVMSSQEVVDFVTQRKGDVSRNAIAQAIVREAMLRGTDDNVCVVLVWLD